MGAFTIIIITIIIQHHHGRHANHNHCQRNDNLHIQYILIDLINNYFNILIDLINNYFDILIDLINNYFNILIDLINNYFNILIDLINDYFNILIDLINNYNKIQFILRKILIITSQLEYLRILHLLRWISSQPPLKLIRGRRSSLWVERSNFRKKFLEILSRFTGFGTFSSSDCHSNFAKNFKMFANPFALKSWRSVKNPLTNAKPIRIGNGWRMSAKRSRREWHLFFPLNLLEIQQSNFPYALHCGLKLHFLS